MYIGRARYTENQNLRKRILEYYRYAPERTKVAEMFREWREEVHCSYIDLSCSNDETDCIEAELVNKLLPHCKECVQNGNQ